MRTERLAWLRLSRRLGMSVARTQLEVSSAEFAEQVAYDEMYPEGVDMDDRRAQQSLAHLANMMGGVAGGKPAQPQMYQFPRPAPFWEQEQVTKPARKETLDARGESQADRLNRARMRIMLGV